MCLWHYIHNHCHRTPMYHSLYTCTTGSNDCQWLLQTAAAAKQLSQQQLEVNIGQLPQHSPSGLGVRLSRPGACLMASPGFNLINPSALGLCVGLQQVPCLLDGPPADGCARHLLHQPWHQANKQRAGATYCHHPAACKWTCSHREKTRTTRHW